MKKLIIESKTHGTKEVLLDESDYEFVTNVPWSWYIRRYKYKDKEKWYGEAKLTESQALKYKELFPDRYITPSGALMMHQFIMNSPKGMHIDHINHDGLDNRRENIRICTPSENAQNKRKRVDSISGYKGVYQYAEKYKLKKRFRAHVQPKGQKRICLGHYLTAEEAAKAYDKKAKELFGDYAELNFPA